MASAARAILPSHVRPINYDISIFDLELGGSFSYQGIVKISLKLQQPTRQIVLNAHQLKLLSASLALQDGSHQEASDITYQDAEQRATVSFAQDLSSDSVLEVRFSGTMNNIMAGFYRSKYKPTVPQAVSVPRDDEYHFMFSTQFESCDARRAFPCFDEPNLKATFDVEIEIPEDQVALSNMPEKGRRPRKNGRTMVSFEKTPVMSTYLLAWAFGDFEYVEDFTKRTYHGKRLPVRVYTTRGLKEQGRYGLEHAHQIIDYFSEIFKIDYPLPKADLLAVHEFSHGAMENWGLVTYRTTAILYDEKQSDAKYKNRVAYVVAHELAHQWFGNLVTMDWWNELWLNEGFATWVGWLATDHLHPEWDIWAQFVTEAVQSAFTMDSMRSSHPIEVPVNNALEIEQIFDAISYLKGSSVIRMLSNHLGTEVFLAGVSNYLKAHAFANATTNDLWSALSKASGKDVHAFMDPWIRKIGFPVVTVAEEPGQISVRQSRFLATGDLKSEEDDTVWWIPLGLTTGDAHGAAPSGALSVKQDTIRNIDDAFYKINSDTSGFYRTNYPPQRLAKLGAQRSRLSVQDSIGLIGDAYALAVAGASTTASLLVLCEQFHDEKSFLVWSQILSSLASIRSNFEENEALSAALKKYVLKLITPAVEKIGWEAGHDEDLLTGQLRSLLIMNAGGAGHDGTITEAKKRFSAYMAGSHDAVHPDLRLAVLRIGVQHGGRSEYEAVKNEYLSTTSIDGKERSLQAMGRVQDPDLIHDFMDFQFSGKVATQDIHSGSASMASNAKARGEMWAYIKSNWTKIHEQLSGNAVILNRWVKLSLQSFASHEVGKDIKQFFADKNTKGYDTGVAQVLDTITRNARYKERDEKIALAWLQAHGYA